ncbi:phospholipid scramblase 2 [Carassius auratus]|uniref:Phospholipid scramblase n=1 Tax=Carassius auratus TaxID=7957 RepID=A0A6P6M165_CARAU|nr:phospholipid scramblase 2-like [Carassius auratus]
MQKKKVLKLFVMKDTLTVLISATADQTICSSLINSNMELTVDTAMLPCPDPYRPLQLESLTWIDQLFVYKEPHPDECFDEVCCGIKPDNRYKVKDNVGNVLFSILEDSDYCSRHLYQGRSFIMNVINESNKEVIRLVHPFVCGSFNHELEVQSPPGFTIGHVRQNWHVCLPQFTVENKRGEAVAKIAGPFLPLTCCVDQNFELVSLNGAATDEPFGEIIKPFSCSVINTGADFVLRFPSDLDVQMKATLLGACILIDFMHYDKPKQQILCLLKYLSPLAVFTLFTLK